MILHWKVSPDIVHELGELQRSHECPRLASEVGAHPLWEIEQRGRGPRDNRAALAQDQVDGTPDRETLECRGAVAASLAGLEEQRLRQRREIAEEESQHQLWADGLRPELCRARGRARRDASAALSVTSSPCADTVHAVGGGSAVDKRGINEDLQGELERREAEHVVHVRVFQARCEQKLQEHRREFHALLETAKSFRALRNEAVRRQALELDALRRLHRAKMAQLEVSSNLFSRELREDSFATAKQVEEKHLRYPMLENIRCNTMSDTSCNSSNKNRRGGKPPLFLVRLSTERWSGPIVFGARSFVRSPKDTHPCMPRVTRHPS